MALIPKSLPLLLLISSTLAQYDYERHSFEGFEGFHHKPVVHHQQQQSLEDHHGEEFDLDYHAHPKYSFDYSVKDPHTGDDKEHWETRDGDKVKGTYTLLETDGTKRVVEYEADDKNGFNAVVHKIGTPKHEEHKPAHEEYKQSDEEYKQSHEEYQPAHEEYHAKPVHEPFNYHEYTHYGDGFIPIAGYDH